MLALLVQQICPRLLGLIHCGPLQCLRGIMSHARLSGSDRGCEFMSTDNPFLILGEGKMLPNDKDNKLIHNSGGPFLMDKLTKQVNIQMYNMMSCEKKATTALDISILHSFHFMLTCLFLPSVGICRYILISSHVFVL